MPRTSRDPQSGAVVHEMTADNLARYDRMKQRVAGAAVGFGRTRDSWGWATADPNEAWPKRQGQNPGIWPPEEEAKS